MNKDVIDPLFYTPVKHKPAIEKPEDAAPAGKDKTIYLDSSFESEPVLDHTFEDSELSDTTEYGYGMWVRYLSTYPEKHSMDPNQFYFLSRLTQNRAYYDFRRFGDRTLAIWLLRNIFVFTTYDAESREKNLDKNIVKVTAELETKWYFV